MAGVPPGSPGGIVGARVVSRAVRAGAGSHAASLHDAVIVGTALPLVALTAPARAPHQPMEPTQPRPWVRVADRVASPTMSPTPEGLEAAFVPVAGSCSTVTTASLATARPAVPAQLTSTPLPTSSQRPASRSNRPFVLQARGASPPALSSAVPPVGSGIAGAAKPIKSGVK
jgi:hypothetical protein